MNNFLITKIISDVELINLTDTKNLQQKKINGITSSTNPEKKVLRDYLEELNEISNGRFADGFAQIITADANCINVYDALLQVTLNLTHKDDSNELVSFLEFIFANIIITLENASYIYFICEYSSEYLNNKANIEYLCTILINLGQIVLICLTLIDATKKIRIKRTRSSSVILALNSFKELNLDNTIFLNKCKELGVRTNE